MIGDRASSIERRGVDDEGEKVTRCDATEVARTSLSELDLARLPVEEMIRYREEHGLVGMPLRIWVEENGWTVTMDGLDCPLDRWRDVDLDETWLNVTVTEMPLRLYEKHRAAGLDPFVAVRRK